MADGAHDRRTRGPTASPYSARFPFRSMTRWSSEMGVGTGRLVRAQAASNLTMQASKQVPQRMQRCRSITWIRPEFEGSNDRGPTLAGQREASIYRDGRICLRARVLRPLK